MERTALSPKMDAAATDMRTFERSDSVLWTVSSPGVVLHNFARRTFLELDATGYVVWGFLDGARPVEEVVAMAVEATGGNGDEAARRVREIVATLIEHGFVEERGDARR